MKRLIVLLVVAAVLLSTASYAGEACRLAEEFRWHSVAQNTACFLEWIWENIY